MSTALKFLLAQSSRTLVIAALECFRHGEILIERKPDRDVLEEAMRAVSLASTALNSCATTLRKLVS
jgi:hypothetical protein